MLKMSAVEKKVLVVDDEAIPRDRLGGAFAKCEEIKFKVYLAEYAREADGLISKNAFDVVTVDLKLGSDVEAGFLWMQKQLLLSSCPEAVKIVVTMFPDRENVIRAMRAGAWDFVFKGEGVYETETVKRAVQRLKELAEAERVEKFLFGDWFPKNEQRLHKEFPGEHLAVDGEGNIIAHGRSRIELGEAFPPEWLKGGRKAFILHL
jgi:DNA-binding NtrC family response regulator